MKSLLLWFMLMILLVSCDFDQMFPNSPLAAKNDDKPTEPPSFRINKAGDTVLLKYTTGGSLFSEIPIRERKKHGLAYNYYPNGNIKLKMKYDHGTKVDSSFYYYSDGMLYRTSFYINGKINGNRRYYYEDGSLMAIVPYSHGELQTGTQEFNKKGEPIRIKEHIVFHEKIKKLPNSKALSLKFSLASGKKKVSYIVLDSQKKILKPIDGIGELVFQLRRGESMIKKVMVAAEFKSNRKIPYRIIGSYNLAFENF